MPLQLVPPRVVVQLPGIPFVNDDSALIIYVEYGEILHRYFGRGVIVGNSVASADTLLVEFWE